MIAKPKRPLGWTLALILVGLYSLLKVQGGWYSFRSRGLERELSTLRPTLTTILMGQQLEGAAQVYAQAFQQVSQMDLQGNQFLTRISQELPASVTLEKLWIRPHGEVWAKGFLLPGGRLPESVLHLWLKRFEQGGSTMEVKELSPDAVHPGLWRFEMNSKEG